jgi:DNA-binding PadR family transcriptional regulator
MSNQADAQDFLPLRPVEFEILLVLAGGEAHGYAIIQEAETRAQGMFRLETGTLYRGLRRLTTSGLIRPTEKRPAPDADDQRRSYYAITELGRRVAVAEAQRLRAQVEAARARELLAGVKGGGS